MKTARLTGPALGLVLLLVAGQAAARPYLNEVTLTAASTASTIQYFDQDAEGATTTAGDRETVKSWSVSSTGGTSVPVDIRIYSKGAPAYTGGTFAAVFTQDFVTLRIQPGQSKTIEGVAMIGYWLEDAPTSGAVTVLGWNK